MNHPRAPGMAWLSVYLTVQNAQRAIDFYTHAFGFALGDTMRDDAGAIQHVEMRYQGEICVLFAPEGAFGGVQKAPATTGTSMPVNFIVYVDDVDQLHAQAQRAGAIVDQPPADMFWGDRTTMLRDPDGYAWLFATHIGSGETAPGATDG